MTALFGLYRSVNLFFLWIFVMLVNPNPAFCDRGFFTEVVGQDRSSTACTYVQSDLDLQPPLLPNEIPYNSSKPISVVARETTLTISDSTDEPVLMEYEIVRVMSLRATEISENMITNW